MSIFHEVDLIEMAIMNTRENTMSNGYLNTCVHFSDNTITFAIVFTKQGRTPAIKDHKVKVISFPCTSFEYET